MRRTLLWLVGTAWLCGCGVDEGLVVDLGGSERDDHGVRLTLGAFETARIELQSDSGALLVSVEGTSPEVPLVISVFELDALESCEDVVGPSGQSAADPIEQVKAPYAFLEHDSGRSGQGFCVVARNANAVDIRTSVELQTAGH